MTRRFRVGALWEVADSDVDRTGSFVANERKLDLVRAMMMRMTVAPSLSRARAS